MSYGGQENIGKKYKDEKRSGEVCPGRGVEEGVSNSMQIWAVERDE